MMRVLLLPVFSGILYWISSQPFSYPLAVWVCLVPLGFSLYKTSSGKGFAGGLIYGFCFWLFAVWWLKIQLIDMVRLPPWQAWAWTLVFCAFHALPYAFFGYLTAKFRWMESHLGVWFASVSLVALRTWYPHVFPGSEAHNLYAWPVFIQVLDLGGAPLLLFLIYLVNFQFVRVFTARGHHGSPVPALIAIAAVFMLLAGYGEYRIRQIHQQMKSANTDRQIMIVGIQPNVPIGQRISSIPPEDRENDVKTAISMSRKAAHSYPGADLIVWPEMPLTYHCREEAGRDLPPLAKETSRAFMLPCTTMVGDKGEAYYNSVTFIDKNGREGEKYHKILLVPFGEYLPLERQFPFLRRIFPGVMPFVSGNNGVWIYDFGEGRKLIPSLCYEAIFTDHIRRFVERGGNVLINMVNDGWFGISHASVIHMSLALFRTVEFRIPLVRVTNSGVGIFVQPTGEIVPDSRTPLFQKAVTGHRLYIPPERSPYERWGKIFLYGLTALFVAGLGWCCLHNHQATRRKKRPVFSSHPFL